MASITGPFTRAALCLCITWAGCGEADEAADAAVAGDASGGAAQGGTGGGADGGSIAGGHGDNDWTHRSGTLGATFNNTGETLLTRDNVASLVSAWTFDTRGEASGTPAVVGDRVYFTSARGTYCADRRTGALLWESNVGATGSPAVADGKVLVLDDNSDLHAFDADSGAELWKMRTDPNSATIGWSSPSPIGDLVVVGNASGDFDDGYRGSIAAHELSTGDQIWLSPNVEPPSNGVSMWSSASADLQAQLVFGTTGNNYFGVSSTRSDSIFALDLATGELMWNAQLREGDVFSVLTLTTNKGPDFDFGTDPILFEAQIDGQRRQLVGAGQKAGIFWALDRMTGETVWQQKVCFGSALGGILNNGASDGTRILVAGFPGRSDGPGSEPNNGKNPHTAVLMALDHATGAIVWERQLPASVWGPITVANGVGFVPVWDEMQAFDTATGEKLAVLPAAGTIASGAVVKDGYVYFGSGFAGIMGVQPIASQVFHAYRLPAAP